MDYKIKAIYFDLFGVLLDINKTQIIQYISSTTKKTPFEIKKILHHELFMQLLRKEISFNEYFLIIKPLLSKSGVIDQNILEKHIKQCQISPLKTVQSIKYLKKYLKIYILTNSNNKQINKLKKNFTFLNLFDNIITAEHAGHYKPNKEIFLYALSLTNMQPKDSVFIDDTKINIQTARSIGFAVHEYKSYSLYMQYLKQKLRLF